MMKSSHRPKKAAAVAVVALSVLVTLRAPALAAAETPRSGGTLTFAVAAKPPSYDGHRETTFAVIHPVAPHYSTLLRFDPEHYPKIVGDVAESWTISGDGLTYTFKLRPGIKFHDGSILTARDVKATYEHIIFPPEGVVSPRKASYAAVEKVEAPNDGTVVFRLKWPAAAMLANLASPWNFICKADLLARDPRWYETHVMGTGPFKFREHVSGSHWVGVKNPDYFVKGRPYLDGYRAIFITDDTARFAAVRSGRALIEFRGVPPAIRDDLRNVLGKQLTVQESPWIVNLTVAINTERKPFDDPRVRRALSLAVDRWEASRELSRISFLKEVGGLLRPGSEFAASEVELTRLAGFGKDVEALRREARRLLKEAGVPEGFSFTFKNRDIKMPYEPLGLFLIDQWRKVGLNVRHVVQETGPYTADLRAGNYETGLDLGVPSFMDDPELLLFKYISANRSPSNYGRYNDARLDELYQKQSRAIDPAERRRLIREFERIVLDEKAYQFPTVWWQRIIVHWARVKGWQITPNHYVNQDLRDVWLAE
jgi:peptide/nickel transport system substrate-binding protein